MSASSSLNDSFFETFARHVGRHKGKTQVIKTGGEVVANEDAIRHHMIQAINLSNLGAYVIEVHGGGVQITAELEKAGIKNEFVGGRRHTSAEAVTITERCLRELNNGIVKIFEEEARRMQADVRAIGFGGFWNNVITAEPLFEETYTGKITHVDGGMLRALSEKSFVPVIYPICAGANGQFMNVNADDAATAIAEAVNADRLILCSNVPGVLDKNKQIIPEIYIDQVPLLIADGTVSGGMIPKVENAALLAANPRIGGVVILDGADPNAIQTELFTDLGAGTLFLRRPEMTP